MTTGIPAIDLYNAHLIADAAMVASDYDLDLCQIADAAYRAYLHAETAARETWNAIPESDAKASAVDNAYDTEGTDANELYWFHVAQSTYDMNIDAGYYNADGSEKA